MAANRVRSAMNRRARVAAIRIRRCIEGHKRSLIHLFWKDDSSHPSGRDCSQLLEEYRRFIAQSGQVSYGVSTYSLDVTDQGTFKWVGAQTNGTDVFFVPNDSPSIVVWDSERHAALAYPTGLDAANGVFRWTGGCMFGDELIAFPRSSCELLRYDTVGRTVQRVSLNVDYSREHHYGGVLTDNGLIVLPPRDEDHILLINPINSAVERIQLAPKWMHARLRYCGSVRHPNGLVYLLPEQNDHVVVLDPESRRTWRIGQPISTMAFGAAIAPNGHMYGFPSDGIGILHIDPFNEKAELIHRDIGRPGCYGTKPGIDGWLYGVPGDGDRLLRYHPESDRIEISLLPSEIIPNARAKWAGGVVLQAGEIVCPPSGEKCVLSLIPDSPRSIPEQLYEAFYSDCF